MVRSSLSVNFHLNFVEGEATTLGKMSANLTREVGIA